MLGFVAFKNWNNFESLLFSSLEYLFNIQNYLYPSPNTFLYVIMIFLVFKILIICNEIYIGIYIFYLY